MLRILKDSMNNKVTHAIKLPYRINLICCSFKQYNFTRRSSAPLKIRLSMKTSDSIPNL